MHRKKISFLTGWALAWTWLLTGASVAQETGEQLSMWKAAPEQALFFTTWNKWGKFSASSDNRTERLLAEAEVQEFLQDLQVRGEKLLQLGAARLEGENRQALLDWVPVVAQSFFQSEGMAFVEKIDWESPELPPVVQAGMVWEFGPRSPEFVEAIVRLVTNNGGTLETVQIGSQSFMVIPPELLAGNPVYFGATKNQVLLAVGQTSAKNLAERLKGNQTTPEWLQKLSQRHAMVRRTNLTQIDIAGLKNLFLPFAGENREQIEAVARVLGLDTLTHLESASGFGKSDMSTRAQFLFSGPPSGIFALAGEQGLTVEELKHLPADALFAVAISVDPNRVWDLSLEVMDAIDPRLKGQFLNEVAQAEREMRVNVKREIFGSLGSTWTLYNGASDGWLSGLAMTTSLRDPQQFSRILSDLVSQFEQVTEGDYSAPRIQQRKIGDSTVYSVTFREAFVPVEPCFSVIDNRLVIGLFPESLIPLARRLKYDPLYTAEALRGLARSQGFSSAETSNGADNSIQGLVYQDARTGFELYYPYMQIVMAALRNSTTFLMGEFNSEDEDLAALQEILGGLTLPASRTIYQHLGPTEVVMRRTGQSWEIESHQTIPTVDTTVAIPVLIGMLLPAVQQTRTAARRVQSTNNLRQMGLAVLNYESAYTRFPAEHTVDDEGRPLLSWRVHILPFIEESNLYEQFHLDEPWDSPHNLQLLEQMPEIYRSPSVATNPGETVYLGVGGPNGPFQNPQPKKFTGGAKIAQILDGTSNSLLIVEANAESAVPWTKPNTSISAETFQPWQIMGVYPGGTNALFCDCSVMFLSEFLDIEDWRALLQINDGRVVEIR